ncbi:MAG: ABC transporter permease subunit [Patescibacteria group bacterium]|jgi:ABC-type transport system involved in multi-copper enzyme maturation permease subunit
MIQNSFKNILSIAKNAFKETIRDRILYGILVFALLFLLSTVFLGSISLGEDTKIIKDLGLAGIYIFSVIITIFIGTSLVYKEIDKRTIYIILSKPVSTAELLLGKFLGLIASITTNIVFMTVVYLVIVLIKTNNLDYNSLWAILLIIPELAIFVALSIFFSTVTAPLSSTIYAIVILYVGHSLSFLMNYVRQVGGTQKTIIEVMYYILPNLEKFNLRNSVVHGTVPSADQIAYPIIYSILYSAVLLYFSNLTLKKCDL